MFRRVLFSTTVNLGHQENSLAISVPQSLPHALLTGAIVIVPAVVHEVDAAINGGANDAHGERFINMLQRQMPATQADG